MFQDKQCKGMTFALLLYANGHDLLRRTHWRAFPIERDCERMVYPLAVERGEGVVVADAGVRAIASR